MTEKHDITNLYVQRKMRPKVEDVVPLIVDGKNQKNALGLIAWLRKNKMAPGWSGVHNAWDAKCKGKTICKISLRSDGWAINDTKGTWHVELYLKNMKQYEDLILSEGLQDIILSRLHGCKYCLSGTKHCVGGFDRTILGKKFNGICNSLYPGIFDPDKAMIANIKKLLEFEQKARMDAASSSPPLSPPSSIEPIFSSQTAKYTRIDNQKRVSGVTGKTKGVINIFDGDYSIDKEYGSRNSSDVLFQLDKPETLKMYSIVTGAREYVPGESTLYGYVEESQQWLELDKQNKATAFPNPIAKHAETAFNIAIPSAHQYYKLSIKSIAGYIQFSQVHLYI